MRTLLAGLMFVCASASAQYVDGNSLHADLTSEKSNLKMYALGYVVGVADISLAAEVLCMPVGVTQGQIQDVVKNFMIANPQARNLPAYLLVQASLGKYWACPDSPKRKKS
jgi:hypothetical protein